MEVTEEVNNWVDVRYWVHNNTEDVQTEIIIDLEGLDLETWHGLRVGNEIENKNDKEECIISVHCTGNCADDIENEKVTECGLRVGICPDKVDRNGLGVGITEVHCEGNCMSNIDRILTSRIDQKGCI